MSTARSLFTVVKLALLLPAYAVFAILAAFAKRPRLSVSLALVIATAVLAASHLTSCSPRVRVGTFNIEHFGARDQRTDMPALTSLALSLDADILAVQEIEDDAKLRDLAASLSRGSRTYGVALSRCGGRSAMRLGFLYDTRRVTLASTREYPDLAPGDDAGCGTRDRPGFLGVFSAGARTLHLLTMHFTPGGDRSNHASRRQQWTRAHKIAAQLRADGAAHVAILGDANSTGYRDDDNGERTYVDTSARSAGMTVVTAGIGCSEYWKPTRNAEYAPSLLDHVIATPGFAKSGSARVHGYCATLRCEPHRSSTPPAEYASVSDHCPVTFDVDGN